MYDYTARISRAFLVDVLRLDLLGLFDLFDLLDLLDTHYIDVHCTICITKNAVKLTWQNLTYET
jgi:hypothetical protein